MDNYYVPQTMDNLHCLIVIIELRGVQSWSVAGLRTEIPRGGASFDKLGGGGWVQFRKGLSKTFLLRSSFGYPRGSISFYISLKMNLGGNYRKISVLGSSVWALNVDVIRWRYMLICRPHGYTVGQGDKKNNILYIFFLSLWVDCNLFKFSY